MIVIEGKNQKSKVLENLLRKELMTNDILIIDTIGINWINPKNDFEHLITESNISYLEVIDLFEKEYSTLKKYDWIAFYVNAEKESIAAFKELDRKYPQNFIVTIQNNNGLTNTYFI